MATKFEEVRYRLATQEILENKSILALALKSMDEAGFSDFSIEEIESCFKSKNKFPRRPNTPEFHHKMYEVKSKALKFSNDGGYASYILVRPDSKEVVKLLVKVIPDYVEQPIVSVFPKVVLSLMQEYGMLANLDIPLLKQQGYDFSKVYTLVIAPNAAEACSNCLYCASIAKESYPAGDMEVGVIPQDQYPIPFYVYTLGSPDKAKNDFMRMMDVIFKSDLSAEERVSLLRETYGVSLSVDDVECIKVLAELGKRNFNVIIENVEAIEIDDPVSFDDSGIS